MQALAVKWSHIVEFISIAGFICAVLSRLALSSYYLKHRPATPCIETGMVHPYTIRDTVVHLTGRELGLAGSGLRNIAIGFWAAGLIAFLATRR